MEDLYLMVVGKEGFVGEGTDGRTIPLLIPPLDHLALRENHTEESGTGGN